MGMGIQPRSKTAHLEFDNFFRRLFRVATFIFVLCMCVLWLRVMYFGWGVFSRSVSFHLASKLLFLSVLQVERRSLGLIRVGPQTVGSIVCCQFIQCFFYGMFYLSELWILGCDTLIICIDKAPGSIVKWLVVCVYVKQYWR